MSLCLGNVQAFGTCRPCNGKRVRRAAHTVCRSAKAEGSRRSFLHGAAAAAAAVVVGWNPLPSLAVGLPPQEFKLLCDPDCATKLDSIETVVTASGLQYKDIVAGNGPNPPVGFQVVAHYVAMTPNLRVFDSSLDKGKPYDIRVGAGQVVPGLDEALLTMKPGGIRRVYVPGNLAFPKGLKAAAGRPSVPPSSPVVFDVQLLYIPGLEDE